METKKRTWQMCTNDLCSKHKLLNVPGFRTCWEIVSSSSSSSAMNVLHYPCLLHSSINPRVIFDARSKKLSFGGILLHPSIYTMAIVSNYSILTEDGEETDAASDVHRGELIIPKTGSGNETPFQEVNSKSRNQ